MYFIKQKTAYEMRISDGSSDVCSSDLQACPVGEHPAVLAMQRLAAELNIYIPTSFFERDGQHHYNSLAMIDDAGEIMGVYRKSHIPDGPGYEEKYHFRPGNSGFKVWETRYGRTEERRVGKKSVS